MIQVKAVKRSAIHSVCNHKDSLSEEHEKDKEHNIESLRRKKERAQTRKDQGLKYNEGDLSIRLDRQKYVEELKNTRESHDSFFEIHPDGTMSEKETGKERKNLINRFCQDSLKEKPPHYKKNKYELKNVARQVIYSPSLHVQARIQALSRRDGPEAQKLLNHYMDQTRKELQDKGILSEKYSMIGTIHSDTSCIHFEFIQKTQNTTRQGIDKIPSTSNKLVGPTASCHFRPSNNFREDKDRQCNFLLENKVLKKLDKVLFERNIPYKEIEDKMRQLIRSSKTVPMKTRIYKKKLKNEVEKKLAGNMQKDRKGQWDKINEERQKTRKPRKQRKRDRDKENDINI